MELFPEYAGWVRRNPPGKLLRQLGRTPLVEEAGRRIGALPVAELGSLTNESSFTATIAPLDSRHQWSLGTAEQLVLQALVSGRKVRTAFEIGTFNGGTTRLLAEAVPEDGQVVTLDLPPAAFDATQTPEGFTGTDVGRAYHDSPAAGKVKQLLENSLSFDPKPYEGQFDLVLVDGGHEYEHGMADTATALRLVAPGGIILWDDFEPYWHGLVRGICEAMQGRALHRLSGTSFGVYVAP
ncbi:MAG: hypothetical protein QOF96_70 [Actinomycetota bacterium]|jgi:predicted O-methyltransferase YrrM|nr:hypothetical protein [Actinomycetota bacterium]